MIPQQEILGDDVRSRKIAHRMESYVRRQILAEKALKLRFGDTVVAVCGGFEGSPVE